MNERIKELASQVLDELVPETWTALKYDKIKEIQFRTAELIVRECYEHCKGQMLPKGMAEENDLNYNDGVMDCARGLKTIFGIE